MDPKDPHHAPFPRAEASEDDLSRFLVDSSVDGILIYDRNFHFTLWNSAMERVSGLSKKQVLGKNAFEILPFLTESGEDRIMRSVITEGRPISSKGHLFQSLQRGKKFHLEGHYSPLKNSSGEIIGGLVIIRDTTEQKQTEAALKKIQEEERIILDSVPAMIWYKDRENRILMCNARAAASKGVTVERMQGHKTEEFYPDEAAKYHADDMEVINSGKPKLGIIEKYETTDGHKIWVKSDKIPYRNEHGEIIGVIVCAEDVTEIKKTEESLKERNADLQKQNDIKSQFISVLSHELRTPINSIKESVQITLDGIDGPLSNEQRETLTITRNNVDRLERLIKNVLDFATLDAGRVYIAPSRVNLNDLLKEVTFFMKPIAQKKNHRLNLQLPLTPQITSCDPDRIKQVMINLLDNAIKYTETGGKISINLNRKDNFNRIEVSDTGIGIRDEDKSHVFEMYAQVKDKRVKRPGGVGIGLALCKQIVEKHNGKIWVESEYEKGSRFMVELPVQ